MNNGVIFISEDLKLLIDEKLHQTSHLTNFLLFCKTVNDNDLSERQFLKILRSFILPTRSTLS